MGAPFAAQLDAIVKARRDFFETGYEDHHSIDPAVFRSWHRCVSTDKLPSQRVEFQPVLNGDVADLVMRNSLLLKASRTPISELERAVAGAGYVVLLTDAVGHAATVRGRVDAYDRTFRSAFRQGVDLSEACVGTTAMSCAIHEGRPVRVFGAEHYFEDNRRFFCAAAPISDLRGGIVGSIDVTRGEAQPDFGALSLVTRCALAIEHQLLLSVPADIILKLTWQVDAGDPSTNLLLALDEDGRITAANGVTRRFLGVDPTESHFSFRDICDSEFGQTIEQLRKATSALPVRLRSGITMLASLLRAPKGRFTSLNVSRNQDKAVFPTSHTETEIEPIPEFGDTSIAEETQNACKALEKHLPILVLGETGTGKDVLARYLHDNSPLSSGPFVAINCAAVPETLIESELFGYVEGAFTGARRGGAPGKFEQASEGTLFLDEIGDMPTHLQARLLRVLESREVCRIGSQTTVRVQFQLVCATHQRLAELIESGVFRLDLYYRINGFSVELPPLRRRSDLSAFISRLHSEISEGKREISSDAVKVLSTHDWPGNVRELKSALTYAHAIAPESACILPCHLPKHVVSNATSSIGGVGHSEAGLLKSTESEMIQIAMEKTDGDVTKAAVILGISRATLYRRLKR